MTDNTFRETLSICIDRILKFSLRGTFGLLQNLNSRILIITQNVFKLLEPLVFPWGRLKLVHQLYQWLVWFVWVRITPTLFYREDVWISCSVYPCIMLASCARLFEFTSAPRALVITIRQLDANRFFVSELLCCSNFLRSFVLS